MATNRIHCDAPPEVVFRALCDPRPYGYFVVGTRRVRRFDPSWPQPGTRFHHSLGFGVTVIRDMTEATVVEEGRRVAMRTYMRPVAVNDVVFSLHPEGEGTRVELAETAVAGPGAREPLREIADGLFWLRNLVVLRRLRTVVERRAANRPAEPKAPVGVAGDGGG